MGRRLDGFFDLLGLYPHHEGGKFREAAKRFAQKRGLDNGEGAWLLREWLRQCDHLDYDGPPCDKNCPVGIQEEEEKVRQRDAAAEDNEVNSACEGGKAVEVVTVHLKNCPRHCESQKHPVIAAMLAMRNKTGGLTDHWRELAQKDMFEDEELWPTAFHHLSKASAPIGPEGGYSRVCPARKNLFSKDS